MTKTLLILIPALPLFAAMLTACLGPWLKERSHWPVVIAMGLSFLCSLMLLKEVNSDAQYGSHAASAAGHIGYEQTFTLWSWADVPNAYPAGVSPGSPADREITRVVVPRCRRMPRPFRLPARRPVFRSPLRSAPTR